MTEHCPTCGSPVTIVSSGEGTNSYQPSPDGLLREALPWYRSGPFEGTVPSFADMLGSAIWETLKNRNVDAARVAYAATADIAAAFDRIVSLYPEFAAPPSGDRPQAACAQCGAMILPDHPRGCKCGDRPQSEPPKYGLTIDGAGKIIGTFRPQRRTQPSPDGLREALAQAADTSAEWVESYRDDASLFPPQSEPSESGSVCKCGSVTPSTTRQSAPTIARRGAASRTSPPSTPVSPTPPRRLTDDSP